MHLHAYLISRQLIVFFGQRTGSGFPFLLPWYHVLPNIFLVLRFIGFFMLSDKLRSLLQSRKQLGIQHAFPLAEPYRKCDVHLSPAFPEMDFPLHIPANVISCGPILGPSQTLTSFDTDLADWIKRPTVLICLGSQYQSTAETAIQMAKGVRVLLEHHEDIQVLWKLRFNWEDSEEFCGTLRDEIAKERVKITRWIVPELISILETNQIVAYVHHGGANSFFEACK
jgi:hypothetical protein